ncbi:MAG: 2Fe-2S iron-sulfur cluster binding domain-containing protein [Gemmatimonadaceae bacterium]|nr:2Fe-2S iron-sulfur cluster binding domain-containing protein [Acetobacteraceae bacterium]
MLHAVITGRDGDIVLRGQPGDSVMQLARAAGLPVLGECNGSLACATCHVIVDPDWAGRLPPQSDDEDAMLDSVFDLMPTSRLSCQIRLTDALDGIRVRLPA